MFSEAVPSMDPVQAEYQEEVESRDDACQCGAPTINEPWDDTILEMRRNIRLTAP